MLILVQYLNRMETRKMMPIQNLTNKKLGIVIPTTGNLLSLQRCITSILKNADESLLSNSEILIFFNRTAQNLTLDTEKISKLFQNHPEVLWRINNSSDYFMTAEESALEAVKQVETEYILLAGDRRIFLPEGLSSLFHWLSEPTTECAYFNSIWQSQQGLILGKFSTLMSESTSDLTYKELVMRLGHNFMSTAMGSWVYKKKYLEVETWKNVIDNGGAHFSHVTTLLLTMGNQKVHAFTTPIFMAEQKKYHIGDSSEWEIYSRLTKKYRYFPWSLGLTRQFKILLESNVYSVMDFRRAMFNEGGNVGRQINEILNFFGLQVFLGRFIKSQRFSLEEFSEIMEFLAPIIPERNQVLEIIRTLYFDERISRRQLKQRRFELFRSINQDHGDLPFASLIVSRVGNHYVRLHPAGFLVSKISDHKDFINAYRQIPDYEMNDSYRVCLRLDEVQKMLSEYAKLRDTNLDSDNAGVSISNLSIRRLWTRRVLFNFKIGYVISDRISFKTKAFLKKFL